MGEIQTYRERRIITLLLAVKRVELNTVLFLTAGDEALSHWV